MRLRTPSGAAPVEPSGPVRLLADIGETRAGKGPLAVRWEMRGWSRSPLVWLSATRPDRTPVPELTTPGTRAAPTVAVEIGGYVILAR